MPPGSKRAKLAKSQRATGTRFFGSQLVEDVLEQALDPNYIPDTDSEIEAEAEDVSDSGLSLGWSFSLDSDTRNITEVSDESDFDIDEVEVLGGKRKAANDKEDYLELCAENAAESAKEFWSKRLITPKPTFHRDVRAPTPQVDPVADSQDLPLSVEEQENSEISLIEDTSEPESAISEAANFPPAGISANKTAENAAEWLNPMIDEDDSNGTPVTVIDSINKLIAESKKFKAFTPLMHLHAVKQFIKLRDHYKMHPKIKNPILRASAVVAQSIGKGPYFARKIRQLHKYIQEFRTLPPVNSGKHHAHPSLLNNESINTAVRRYLTVIADGEITPLCLMKQVNEVIIPGLGLDLGGQKISERCARRWLFKLGYELCEAKKGMYVDGHEHPDVVEYRKEMLDAFVPLERYRRFYKDEDLEPVEPQLPNANDLRRRVYVRDGKMPLRKKGQGRAIHISDFVVEHYGRLKLTDEMLKENEKLPSEQRLTCTDAREIMYPGKNAEGWWNTEHLIAQVQRAIPIFERMYPGAVGEWIFDQSSAHGAFAKDALNSKEMNVGPGGKQRKMHNTIIPMDNPHPHLRGQIQQMVLPKNPPKKNQNKKNQAKQKGRKMERKKRGLLAMLTEINGGKLVGECKFCKSSREAQDKLLHEARATLAGEEEPDELIEDILQASISSTCCMSKALQCQADFRAEKSLLQTILEKAGHHCYFLPKFHCELNPIEMYWGWSKARFRVAADGAFPKAKVLVPEILDSCPTKTIRAFFRKAWRYMDAYHRKGLNAKQAEFAVKKYKSHRRCGPAVMMSLGILDNPA
ncbi:hypothetical protein M422DRAFT_253429 [Sphaerobolus stellatus SS14]|uniref:Tc1-like transposase DDE domain-containing protein n=1 Tax=Sphaerobolus stellatus (strain SS14) TaxID=990650 RepID=A0A0C9VWN0_SPHS4|nr:hypothetical protein M422DRAFT_253429 [Sphaerobolus stellatus SS14]